MRKVLFGLSAVALLATATAFADDEDNARVATAESMTPSFTKLDADADGRVSAIEAANNSRVAAGFTAADTNKDGYLSAAEYAQLAKASSSTVTPSSRTADEPSPSDGSERSPAPK